LNFQIPIPLGSLPITLYCISDASVAFVPNQPFKTIVDYSGGLEAIFDNEGFTIAGESYNYREKIWYKDSPSVVEWLQRQKLIMPILQ
jgi:hypothetical protein